MKRIIKAFVLYVGEHWYERLTSIFIAVIMAGTLAIFEGFWWDETYSIAYYSLTIAVLIDLLAPLRFHTIKLLLKLMAVIVITTKLARMEWAVVTPQGWREWLWWLEAHAVQLHPFIWISAALLLLHGLFSTWAHSRPRMFGVIGSSLLILTIADSFTPIWLWDNVGLVVFIGLDG